MNKSKLSMCAGLLCFLAACGSSQNSQSTLHSREEIRKVNLHRFPVVNEGGLWVQRIESSDSEATLVLALTNVSGEPKVEAVPDHKLAAQCVYANVIEVRRLDPPSGNRYEVKVDYQYNWDDGLNACIFELKRPGQMPTLLSIEYYIDG
jgi:hypothetical protein